MLPSSARCVGWNRRPSRDCVASSSPPSPPGASSPLTKPPHRNHDMIRCSFLCQLNTHTQHWLRCARHPSRHNHIAWSRTSTIGRRRTAQRRAWKIHTAAIPTLTSSRGASLRVRCGGNLMLCFVVAWYHPPNETQQLVVAIPGVR